MNLFFFDCVGIALLAKKVIHFSKNIKHREVLYRVCRICNSISLWQRYILYFFCVSIYDILRWPKLIYSKMWKDIRLMVTVGWLLVP